MQIEKVIYLVTSSTSTLPFLYCWSLLPFLLLTSVVLFLQHLSLPPTIYSPPHCLLSSSPKNSLFLTLSFSPSFYSLIFNSLSLSFSPSLPPSLPPSE